MIRLKGKLLKMMGAALILALVGAACSSTARTTAESETPTASTDATSTSSNGGPDTAAAGLRATLTQLLVDHEYLAGLAINTAVNTGLDSAATKAATGALDDNSVALSDAIDSVYPGGGKTFLPLWRKHIGFFVDYAVAGVKKDSAGQAKAKKELDGYRADFGAFIASANPNLTKEAVADALLPHTTSTFDAIDAVLAKSPDLFSKLHKAAGLLPPVANVLAGAISKQYPEKISGNADSAGSGLRSALTQLLVEHEYLAGLAINTAVTTGLDSPATKAATAALDDNSVQLSDAIDSVYAGGGKTFLPLWRKHIGFFVSYAVGGVKKDAAAQAKAKSELDGYRADFGAFIASANPNLTKDAVADALLPHTTSTFDTIDAVIAGSPEVFAKLHKAAGLLPPVANVLAGAIAKQYPDKFSV